VFSSPYDGDAREFEHPADHRKLRFERVRDDLDVGGIRHGLRDTVRLVCRNQVHTPLGAPIVVPARDQMRRAVVRGQPGDHVQEAANRVHRCAVGAADRVRQAIKGAKVQGRSIKQHQAVWHT